MTTFRHLLSPILRRWCTSSTSTSSCANSCERYELKGRKDSHDFVLECDDVNDRNEEDQISINETKEYDKEFHETPNMKRKEPDIMRCGVVKRSLVGSSKSPTLPKQMSFHDVKQFGSTKNNKGQISATKQLVRGNSNQETLSKDEARRRMLSWRKTTKLRKSSDHASVTNGSTKRSKESRQVRRIVSNIEAAADS